MQKSQKLLLSAETIRALTQEQDARPRVCQMQSDSCGESRMHCEGEDIRLA